MVGDRDVYTTRRRLIASSSIGLAALAGCLSGSGGSATTTDSGTTFELRSLDVPETVRIGESLPVTPIVGNAGETDATQELTVSIGPLQQTVDAEVAAGDAVPVEATIDTGPLEPGAQTVTVSVGGTSETTTVALFPADLDPGIHGIVSTAASTDLAGSRIETYSGADDASDPSGLQVEENGLFAIDHLSEPPYSVSLSLTKASPGSDDGIPAIFDVVSNFEVDSETVVLGHTRVPTAYWTQVQLVDGDGNPITDFSNFSVYNGQSGIGTRGYTTSTDGLLVGRGASEPGIAAPARESEPLTMGTYSQARGEFVTFGTVYGSEGGAEFTFEVANPDEL